MVPAQWNTLRNLSSKIHSHNRVYCPLERIENLRYDAARAKETFHSTARQAAEIAYKAQVKRLVIGHYSARYEDMAPLKKEADKIFPGTILGEEGMRLSV